MRTSLRLLLLAATVSFAAEGFYKDVFMDGGTGLTHRTRLYAAESLGLSYEYLAREDTSFLNHIVIGNFEDANGCLLYPDGAPRFRLVYTNGGDAYVHGVAMGDTGRQRIRDFFNHGGSYSGSCAGAYIASLSNQDSGASPYFYRIWPGRTKDTRIRDAYVGNFIPPESPLLRYDSFGGDFYIESLYVYNGPYANESINWPQGTEVLLRYDTAGYFAHQKVSAWAYKPADTTGRIALLGTHPEGWPFGEWLHLTKAVFRYALDGVAPPRLKAGLATGVPRVMDQPTGGDPAFARIGDRQYHHFFCDLVRDMTELSDNSDRVPSIARRTERRGLSPSGDFGSCPNARAKNLTVSITASDSYQLNLFLKHDTFAFRSNADYADTTLGGHKTVTITSPTAGRWYVGVELATTVSTYGDSCFLYKDSLHVLNGIPYTVTATWDSSGSVSEPRPLSLAPRPSLSATPNPFRTSTFIHLTTGPLEHSPTSVRIHDASGRLVASSSAPNATLKETPDGLVWRPGASTPAGVYIVRVQLVERSLTTRIIFSP